MKGLGVVAVLAGAVLAVAFWKTNERCVTLYWRAPSGTWVMQSNASPTCPVVHLPAAEVLASGKVDDEAAVTVVHNRYLRVGHHVTEAASPAPGRVVSGQALFYGGWAGVALAPLIVWLVVSLAVEIGTKRREEARP